MGWMHLADTEGRKVYGAASGVGVYEKKEIKKETDMGDRECGPHAKVLAFRGATFSLT